MDVDRSGPLHAGQQKMSDIIEPFPNDLDLRPNEGFSCPAAQTSTIADPATSGQNLLFALQHLHQLPTIFAPHQTQKIAPVTPRRSRVSLQAGLACARLSTFENSNQIEIEKFPNEQEIEATFLHTR